MAALRRAFFAMARTKTFWRTPRRRDFYVAPTPGEAVARVAQRIAGAPAGDRARLSDVLSVKKRRATCSVTGLVPVVGIPLPLVSYGGTSMMTLMVGLGLAMSGYVHGREGGQAATRPVLTALLTGCERQAPRTRQRCGQARLPMLCAATTGPVFRPLCASSR